MNNTEVLNIILKTSQIKSEMWKRFFKFYLDILSWNPNRLRETKALTRYFSYQNDPKLACQICSSNWIRDETGRFWWNRWLHRVFWKDGIWHGNRNESEILFRQLSDKKYFVMKLSKIIFIFIYFIYIAWIFFKEVEATSSRNCTKIEQIRKATS